MNQLTSLGLSGSARMKSSGGSKARKLAPGDEEVVGLILDGCWAFQMYVLRKEVVKNIKGWLSSVATVCQFVKYLKDSNFQLTWC